MILLRLTRWLFLLSLCGLALALYHKDRLPDPAFYDERMQQEPRQEQSAEPPFTAQAGKQSYRITPLYDYELDGLVVSHHRADDWANIYHRERKDFLNLKDLCVLWGDNARSGVYRNMGFDNTSWTCWYQWSDRETGERFQPRQLSNNHLLSDNPAVSRLILDADVGDQIHFSGVLANYENPASGFKRGTSTRRDDSGNGACETVYVKEFSILRQANRGWRALYGLTLWTAPLAAIGWLALVMAGIPATRRG